MVEAAGPGTCRLAVCLLLWAATAPTAAAQVGAGAIAGGVLDQAGSPVPGATVTIVGAGTNRARTVITAGDGGFVVPALPPGAYRIRVDLVGFRPTAREGVFVTTGETVRIDLRLELGGLSEALVVRADAPLLRGESGSLGHVVDNRRVTSLPLEGRSFVALAALVPGVTMPPRPAAPLPRINGGRPRTNEYLFDGISVLQPEPGQVAFFPNVDAIQEFKVETNSPPAEFGRFNGGVINLTTKSGTNAVRGTAFEFFRHEALNARNAFASTDPDDPKFRRHQFGGVVGGPVLRNRTFFFTDYQGQRQTIGRTVVSTVPTLLQRQGIFTEPVAGRVPAIYDPATTGIGPGGLPTRAPFPGNAIPAGRFDPVARALLERFPLPTSPGAANNYRRTSHETVDQDLASLRVDHRLDAERGHVFGRLTRLAETFLPVTPLPDGSGAASGALGPQDTVSWSFASGYQRTLSATVVNELRVGDTRRSVRRSAVRLAGPASLALGLPGIPDSARFADTLPSFLIPGYQSLGSPRNTASDFATSVTQVADTLTWLRERHTVRVGADLRWSRMNVLQPPSPTGAFTFSSLFTGLPGVAGTGTPLASFLLGQVEHFSIDLQHDEIRNRAHVQEYFAQDDWRLSNRVTVNAGVRYTLNFPSTESTDQAAVFNLQTRQMEYLGRDGRPRSARRLHTHNLGPRLGIAGRLTDRMVLRAGYALVWIEMAGITTPFTTPAFPFLQTVSQRTLDNLTPAFTLAQGPTVSAVPLTPDAGLGQGVFAVDRDLGSGYVQQWNVSWQRELAPNLSLEVAYAGSSIARLGLPDTNLNQLTAAQLSLGPALLERVANPYFGVIPRSSSLGDPTTSVAQLLKPFPQQTTVSLYRHNVGTSHYHGASVKLDQRLSGGVAYTVSYTRSRLMDDASSVFDASVLTGPATSFPVADGFNRRLERDYSNGDIPHVLVASAIWDLPWGDGRLRRARGLFRALVSDWTLSGIVTLQSGTPLAVTQATNHNAFAGFGTQRPNLAGNPTLPAGQRSTGRWFNTSAFQEAPPFALGTSSRNPIRGPGYRNLDLALVRRLALGGSGRALELRAEVFNATNTPPLGPPNTTLGAAGFGTITSAGDPRVVQLAVKVVF